MRKGEVMALKWENVDFEERKIYIKNSTNTVSFPAFHFVLILVSF